jgi:hypothetical protein
METPENIGEKQKTKEKRKWRTRTNVVGLERTN